MFAPREKFWFNLTVKNMIIALIGNIGEGKSVSMIKEIVTRKNFVLTNFHIKYSHHRLRYTDFFIMDEDNRIIGVNWQFWDDMRKKHKDFSIFLDEVPSIVHSRASMTKRNIYLSHWISQVRKILSDSPNSHLYIVSQTPRKIDVNWRELCHIVIKCKKITQGKNVYILQTFYDGFDSYEMGVNQGKKYFLANPFFKYYNTNELVKFSDADEYL